MKIATYATVAAEAASIFAARPFLPLNIRIAGLFLAAAGDAAFLCAVLTMKDSWRAGIPESDRTEIVTGGIYSISRNPAFLAFDLVYLGILPTVFGDEYLDYKSRVRRYFGRKK